MKLSTSYKGLVLGISLVNVIGLFPESGSAAPGGTGSAKVTTTQQKTESTKDASTPQRDVRAENQAENQNMTAYETELVRKIRSAIAADAALSMEAKNVVITANNGKILLQGSVSNAEEKARVTETAKRHSGAMTVVDQTVINR
jgi:osmotically-inducible protein OsmY